MDTPLVSVIIPTHSGNGKLRRLVHSILKSDYKKIEIIIVDDASPFGISEEIRSIQNVKIIRNQTEKWLSASRNIGIKNAKGDFYFFVDDDNVLAKNTIDELVKVLRSNPSIGIACPLTYYFKDPKKIWWAGTVRSKVASLTRSIGKDQLDVHQFRSLIESESFRNAFMIKKEVIRRVGLFDEKFFPIHYDEGDLAERVKKEGFKIMVVPAAKVWHDIPPFWSTKPRSLHVHSPIRGYYGIRNRILFHKRWRLNWLQFIITLGFISLITIYYAVIVLLYSPPTQKCDILKSMLRGFWDGLRIRI